MKRLILLSTIALGLGSSFFRAHTVVAQTGFAFQPIRSYALPDSPISPAIGDFDGNSLPDLAVANFSHTEPVSVLLSKGNGFFEDAISFDGGNGTFNLALGDFNSDGHLDLAASAIRWDVMIYLGNGDGTFQPTRVLRNVADQTEDIIVRDVNRDGEEDLLVAFNAGYGLEDAWLGVFLGIGNGTFQEPKYKQLGRTLKSIAIDDFNLDGNHDVAWTSWVSTDVTVCAVMVMGPSKLVSHIGLGEWDEPSSQPISITTELWIWQQSQATLSVM